MMYCMETKYFFPTKGHFCTKVMGYAYYGAGKKSTHPFWQKSAYKRLGAVKAAVPVRLGLVNFEHRHKRFLRDI